MGLRCRLNKVLFLFLLGCGFTPLFSTSIQLMNDSAYPLNAQVLDRAGRHLAYIHLLPGQLYIYDASQGAFDKNINATYTPFTVLFLCDSGRPYDYSVRPKKPKKGQKVNNSEYIDQFGVWTHVPRGSTVNALGCPYGTKSCISRTNKKVHSKKTSQGTRNEGSNSWSNDGGSSWTNDSSSGESCTDWGGCPLRTNNDRETHQGRRPWSNADEVHFQTEQGDVWVNDNSQEFDNDDSQKDQSSTSTNNTKSKSKNSSSNKKSSQFSNDGGQSWTNDQEAPSKATPMPFQTRKKNS